MIDTLMYEWNQVNKTTRLALTADLKINNKGNFNDMYRNPTAMMLPFK